MHLNLGETELEGVNPDDLALLLSGDWEEAIAEEQPLSDWLMTETEILLALYLPPVLTLLGLLGNCTVLLPALRLAVSSVACPLHIYAALIIVLHTVLLIASYGLPWVDMYFAGRRWLRQVRVKSEEHCLVSNYVENLIVGLDRWLLVVFTGECLVLARNPQRAFHFRRDRVLDAVIIVVTVMASVNLHHFWTNEHEIHTLKAKTCHLRVRYLNGKEGGELYGTIISQISLLIVEILPSLGLTTIFVLGVRMRCRSCSPKRCCRCCHQQNSNSNNGEQQVFSQQRQRRSSKTISAGMRMAVPSATVVTMDISEAALPAGEITRAAWKKRTAYFVLDSDSYDDMARAVGPFLGLTYVICLLPNLLIVQPVDRFVMQRLEGANHAAWTLILTMTNTLYAIYLSLPPLVLLLHCRRYRNDVFQLIRKCFFTCYWG